MTAGPWNTGGRPDAADLEAARVFAEGLRDRPSSGSAPDDGR